METKRSAEIRLEINRLESHISFITSMISLLMAEGNLIDAQIENFTRDGVSTRDKIRDLQAELKDTI